MGGCASYSNLLISGLEQCDSINSIRLLTETASSHTYRVTRNKIHIYRTLPRRDSKPRKNLPLHALTFLITQLQIAIFLIQFSLSGSGTKIVHIHNRFGRRWIGLYCRMLNIQSVLDIRDRFYHEGGLKAYDSIICASQNIYLDLRSRGLKKVLLKSVPIDLSEIRAVARLSRSEAKPFILFVGVVSHGKGVLKLIESYKATKTCKENFNLVIIGPSHIKNFDEYLIERNIEYLGVVERKIVLETIQQSSLLVLPSESEGMPRVALEAIGLGVPTILPRGIPEFDTFCRNCVLDEDNGKPLSAMLDEPFHRYLSKDFPINDYDSAHYCDELAHSVYKHVSL